MYYWAIKWKSFNEDELLVNQKQKDYIEGEWEKQPEARQSQTFKIKGETYSYNSIERIVMTTKKILDSQKMLYAAGAQMAKREPLIDDEGCVVTAWYKRYVSSKEYEKKYYGHHGYYTLDKEDGGLWIAFRKVMEVNGRPSDDIEPCTEAESERLWNYTKAS